MYNRLLGLLWIAALVGYTESALVNVRLLSYSIFHRISSQPSAKSQPPISYPSFSNFLLFLFRSCNTKLFRGKESTRRRNKFTFFIGWISWKLSFEKTCRTISLLNLEFIKHISKLHPCNFAIKFHKFNPRKKLVHTTKM